MKNKNFRNYIFKIACRIMIIFLISLLIGISDASTLIVDKNGFGDYTSIQQAIDSSGNLDTIRIFSGVYNENLVIRKPLFIIGNGSGETIIVAKNPADHAVSINGVKYLQISGISVANATSNLMAGIYVLDSINVNLTGIELSRNNFGIYFYNSSNSIISQSKITQNDIGIRIYSSNNNIIQENTVDRNRKNVYLYLASQNQIKKNDILNAFEEGVLLDRSETNIVSGNNIFNAITGVYIYISSNNVIEDGIIRNNGESGITLDGDSRNNTVQNMNLIGNTNNAIYLSRSSYNNFINIRSIGSNIGFKAIQNSEYTHINDSYFILKNTGISFIDSGSNHIWNVTLSGGSYRGIELTGSDENFFENISVENSGSNHGIYIDRSSNNIFTKINSTGSNMGMDFLSSNNNSLDRSIINAYFIGISFTFSNDSDIKNSKISGSSGSGIELKGSVRNIFSDIVLINENAEYGIHLADSVNNSFNNIYSSSNNTGFSSEFSSLSKIDNIVINSTGTGLSFISSKDNTIFNASISGSKNIGLGIQNSDRNNFSRIVLLNNYSVYGIFLKNSDYNYFYDVFSNMSSNGSSLESSSNNLISNITIYSTLKGLSFISSGNNFVEDSWILENNEKGLEIQDSDRNNFSRMVLLNNNSAYGIFLNNSDTNYFYDIFSNRSNNGSSLESSSNNLISNITIYSTLKGFSLILSSDNYVEDSRFLENTEKGLEIQDSDGNNFSRMILLNDNSAYGLFMQNSVNNNFFDIFSNQSNYGLSSEFSSNNYFVNIYFDSRITGISFVSSGENKIMKSTISGNTEKGLEMQDSKSNNFSEMILLNENSDYGIYLLGSDDNSFQTLFSNKSTNGFRSESSSQNKIKDINIASIDTGLSISSSENDILVNASLTGNTKTGLELSNSNRNTFSNINLRNNNSNYGIFLSNSGDNSFSGIFSDSSSTGIWLESSSGCLITNMTVNSKTIGADLISSNENIMTGISLSGNSNIGIKLLNSNLNNFLNVSLGNDNANYGINLSGSSNNFFKNITSNYNKYGAYILSSIQNSIIDSNFSGNRISGIQINTNSDDNNITNNTILYGKWHGISIEGSDRNSIINNTISENQENSIMLDRSDENNISGNNIFLNSGGVRVYYSGRNIIDSNIITNSYWEGIRVDHSDFNILNNNKINNLETSADGIRLDYSLNSILSGNIVESSKYGLYLSQGSNSNTIFMNTLSKNSVGIMMNLTDSNIAHSNHVIENSNYGIQLLESRNNTIYNNFLNNAVSAYDDSGMNNWNTTKRDETNIIGFPFIGGNYWSDYMGFDVNGDGLGDTDIPYNSGSFIITGGDYHPLSDPADAVWVWGQNNFGQVGEGTYIDRYAPSYVKGLSGVIAVAGGSFHTLALKRDGTVWAWGLNDHGQLGDGTTINRNTPIQVKGLSNVKAIAGGALHSAALMNNGTVWTWGYNYAGQLGDNTTMDRYTPVNVVSLSGIIAISSGWDHMLAIGTDGIVYSWGYNKAGQIGDNTTVDRYLPVAVKGISNITAISAGRDHSIALKGDGNVWTWGENSHGQLGDSTLVDKYTPVLVRWIENVTAISAGAEHTAVLKEDGTVWSWGRNDEGQLGDGSNIERLTPVPVNGYSNVGIKTGGYHTIALKSNGDVWAWGANLKGQIGDNTTFNTNSPVKVIRISRISVIAGGCWHTIALSIPNPSVIDSTPPSPISMLRNLTYAPDYINWTWIDSEDADFAYVMVYIDSIFKTTVSKGVEFYNISGFEADTEHTISTRTVDTYYNIDPTWMNHTARTSKVPDITPVTPKTSVSDLKNISYAPDYINWTWIDSEDADFAYVMVYIDSIFRTNVSKGVEFINISGLEADTEHTISTKTVDIYNNIDPTWMNYTARTSKGPDATPKTSVSNLKNITYAPDYINWTWIDSEDADFAYVMVYIDTIFKTNVSKGVEFYNISGFEADTEHTISTKTVDVYNNIDLTWMNHTSRTSKLPEITSTISTYTGSSGGGGGGGGGGTTGENFSNIELKENYDRSIFKDETTSIMFRDERNPIRFINITGKGNAGEINTAIEVLKSLSSLSKSPAPGNVYKYINIWMGTFRFAEPRNIKQGEIMFMVNKEWAKSSGPNSVKLFILNDTWTGLETKLIGENSDYFYYKAFSQKFSSNFAISAQGSYTSESKIINSPDPAINTVIIYPTDYETEPESTPISTPTEEFLNKNNSTATVKTPGYDMTSAFLMIFAYFLYSRKKNGL